MNNRIYFCGLFDLVKVKVPNNYINISINMLHVITVTAAVNAYPDFSLTEEEHEKATLMYEDFLKYQTIERDIEEAYFRFVNMDKDISPDMQKFITILSKGTINDISEMKIF